MSHDKTSPQKSESHVPMGSTIGIVVGGQLGRMAALAAAPLGYRVHVYNDAPDSPTAQICSQETVAPYDDEAALEAFARSVDVVTYEWENIPLETLRIIERHCVVRPSPDILEISQDRALEKQFANDAGLETAPWVEVDSLEALRQAVIDLGTPCIIKSARFGYDGKGQVKISSPDQVEQAWEDLGKVRCIVEGLIDFRAELSVIIARSPSGQVAIFDPVENHHVEQVLEATYAPARIEAPILARAVEIAQTLAGTMNLEGLLAVELFLTNDDRLLINEVAPRPHNSGHWTIDACHTSQFEQFVRAICNLPLGSPARHSDAIMHNLLGPIGPRWLETLQQPTTKLHLYGKKDARPGRKTGHITRVLPLTEINAAILE
ncbi:MAG: 5-(carboxyamino)imidazole ribonucleotide synthase [Bradymonadaceae bacterium]